MAAINRIKAIDVAIAMKRFAVPPSDADIEVVIRVVFPRAVNEDIASILRIAEALSAEERKLTHEP